MEINITDNNAYQSRLKELDIIWLFYHRKWLKIFLIQLVIAVVLIILGLLDRGYTMINPHPFPAEKANIIYFNLHILLSIGIVFIGILSINLNTNFRSKNAYQIQGKLNNKKYFQQPNQSNLRLTEYLVNYSDNLLQVELKWPAFTHYCLMNDILFLTFSKNLNTGICIHRNLVSEQDFSTLLSLAKTHFILIK